MDTPFDTAAGPEPAPSLGERLDEYSKPIAAWMDLCKKQTAAVHKLQAAVAGGALRDVERLRQAALAATTAAAEHAGGLPPLEFDAARWLSDEDGFLAEIRAAAEEAGVRLYERDGVVFCYPV
ncbi:MAG TPA: hypothetical protein VGM37_11360, partial [Armatimonadota bacterium]